MTKFKLFCILLGAVLLLEGGMYASAKYNIPPELADHPVFGKVELGHCPILRRGNFNGRPGDVHNFNIPSGEIRQTIPCFSVEAGLTESWGGGEDGEDIYKQTAAVKGRMSSLEALTRMLAPTDFEIIPPKPDAGRIEYKSKPKAQERGS